MTLEPIGSLVVFLGSVFCLYMEDIEAGGRAPRTEISLGIRHEDGGATQSGIGSTVGDLCRSIVAKSLVPTSASPAFPRSLAVGHVTLPLSINSRWCTWVLVTKDP